MLGHHSVASDAEILSYFGLRTSPLSPSIGRDGQPISPALFDRALDPVTVPDVVYYYFDFYKWGEGPIKGISDNSLFERFPARSASHSMLVLVSGNSKSGRKSIVNRLIKKIEVDDAALPRDGKPLIVPITFAEKNRDENVGIVANWLVFMFEMEHAGTVESALRTQLSNAAKDNTLNAYTQFFARYRFLTQSVTNRSVVFRINSEKPDFKSWAAAYSATRSLPGCMIIETGSSGEADATVNVFHSKNDPAPVVHIRAAPLDVGTARAYLKMRIAHERKLPVRAGQGIGELAPFTEDAIKELFAPTHPGDTVDLSIWQVRERLKLALERHISKLQQVAVARGLEAIVGLPTLELAIKKQDMRLACNLVSKGTTP